MKKTIRDYDLNEKKVIIRVDFNVPMENGIITDDNRIIESLPTIKYAIQNNAKVILMSHMGRIKKEEDKANNTLLPVSKRLSELLEKNVVFSPETRGTNLENKINNLKRGEVLLIENTRFEDLDNKKESSNDLELGKYWASLADIYINDAFGLVHRSHASNSALAQNLPNGIGFLIEKELENLEYVLDNPKKPFDVILGGSKVSDKIGVIENLINKVDHILIGGGMAFTFLKASGINIGKSLCDNENIDFCKKMLEKYESKIILPIDVICSKEIGSDSKECFITDMKDDDIGLDIGSQTIKLFKDILVDSKIVVWNGPMGMFEHENYSKGTKNLCETLKNINADVIIGGGDTASAAINFGYKNAYKHISTGGGASLYLLEGKKLPAIEIISNK